MAKFCANCGAQITEGKKFCANCGTKAEETGYQAPPAQQAANQQPPQPQYNEFQPQYQQQPYAYAPIQKKKSVLPLILVIAGVLVLGIAALVIFVVVPALTGGNKPSPDNSDPTSAVSDQTKKTSEPTDPKIEDEGFGLFSNKTSYEPGEAIILTVAGNIDRQMLDGYAFIAITRAGDGHGDGIDYINLEKNVNQYTAYAPSEPGAYEARLYKNASASLDSLLASLAFDVVGPQSAGENEQLAGLWRNEDDEGNIALYHYRSDFSFSMQVLYADGSELVLIGKYRISGETIYLYNRIYNGDRLDGEGVISFDVSGDFMSFDGEICQRVPDEYVDAVLADPKAPYPPGSDDFDWENFDWENFDWESLFD
jgi:hypothetical protein